MKSDFIRISGNGSNMQDALNEAEKVAAYKGLTGKNALYLQLMTEELMGMMRSITGEDTGIYWIEEVNGVYSLHLKVETLVDSKKRRQLITASKSGENEAAKGVMGKLREFFFRSADEEIAAYTSPMLTSGLYRNYSAPSTNWEWSMKHYVDAYNEKASHTKEEKEAWDELEKSVVSHVTDNVKVSIRGWETEMILVKKMA